MKITKKLHLPNAILLSISTVCMVPNTGTSNPPVTTAIFNPSFLPSNDPIISSLADQTKSGDIEKILHELENVAEMLEKSDDPLADSCTFLQNFIHRMNGEFGTSITLSGVLGLTRDSIHLFPISESEIGNYLLGLNLIDSASQLGSCNLVSHHKRSNVWSWLTVATITVGTVAICIFCPQVADRLIDGAVQISKSIIENTK